MSTERPQRHALDGLLAGSVEALPHERPWPTHPALQGEGLRSEGQERRAEREPTQQEDRFERASRAHVEAELERLRSSFSALRPLVHALHRAMGEIPGAIAQGPEAGAAHGGGEGGEAGGGGGTKQAPPAAADSIAGTGFAAAGQGAADLLRALVDVLVRRRAPRPVG